MASHNKENSLSQNEPVEDDETMVEGNNSEDKPNKSFTDITEDTNLSPEFSDKVRISVDEEVIEIESDTEGIEAHEGLERNKKIVSDRSGRPNQSTHEIVNRVIDKKDSTCSRPDRLQGTADKLGEFLYKCNCGEFFKKSTELAAHKRWTCKLVEKKFQCHICLLWFARERGLRRHMKHTHEGDFHCTHCNLRFHNQIRLTRHWMEFHFDESNKEHKLKCFQCGNDSFKDKFDLESHLLFHKYYPMETKKNIEAKRVLHEGKERLRSLEKNAETVSIDLTAAEETVSQPFSSLSGSQERLTSMPWSCCGPSGHHYRRHGHCHHHGHGHHHGHRGHHHRPHRHHHHRWHQSPDPDEHVTSTTQSDEYSEKLCKSQQTQQSFATGQHILPPYPYPTFHPPHPPPHNHPHTSPHVPPHTPPHPPPHIPPHSAPHPYHPPSSQLHPPFWQPPFHQEFPYFSKPSMAAPNSSYFYSPFMNKPWKTYNKSKWKKYFKNMMCQFLSPWSYGFYPSPNQLGTRQPDLQSSGGSFQQSSSADVPTSNTAPCISDTVEEPDPISDTHSFKMSCTFCGQIIEKGKVLEHRSHKCPVSNTFRCSVCGKEFQKHYRFIRHLLSEHTQLSSLPGQPVDASAISYLEEKLTSVLDLENQPTTSTNSSSYCSQPDSQKSFHNLLKPSSTYTISDKLVPQSSSSCFHPQPSNSQVKFSVNNENISSQMVGSDVAECVLNNNESEQSHLVIDEGRFVACSVCHAKLDSTKMLCLHLQAHITHVNAIQKVHEWKKKSSPYFDDGDKDDSSSISYVDSSTDALSVTTDTSFQDTSSTNFSSLGTVDISSEKATSVNNSEKWSKPQKKKKKDRNEIFTCEFCNENFAFKKSLNFHMKEKHRDKKLQLECPVCLKKFSWKKRGQFYERHLSSHYGVTVFKHKCEICDKTFLEKCKLQAHMAQHKAELLLSCQICGKGYGSKSSLTRHMRQHTGDKPHQCDVCSETFLEKRELIRHMATHTGTPPFICPHCSQGFTLKTSLDMHIKRKHT